MKKNRHFSFFYNFCISIFDLAKKQKGKFFLFTIFIAFLLRFLFMNLQYLGSNAFDDDSYHDSPFRAHAQMIEKGADIVDFGSIRVTDQTEYILSALALRDFGEYVTYRNSKREPETFRMPGFPFILAIVSTFFEGRDFFTAISLLQNILGIFSIIIFYLIAKRLWKKEWIANIVALFMALDLYLASFTVFVLTETLFVAVMSVSIYFSVKLFQDEKPPDAFLAGIFWTASVFVRSYVMYLLPAIAMLFFIKYWKKNKKKGLLIIFLMLCPLLVSTQLWNFRNFKSTGEYSFATSRYSILTVRGSELEAQNRGKKFAVFWADDFEQWRDDLLGEPAEGLSTFELESRLNRIGVDIILENKSRFLINSIENIFVTLFLPGEPFLSAFTIDGHYGKGAVGGAIEEILRYANVYRVPFVFSVFYFLELLLVYYFFTRTIINSLFVEKDKQYINLLFLGILAYFLFVFFIYTRGVPRYRIPLMPIFFLYASKGIYDYFYSLKKLN